LALCGLKTGLCLQFCTNESGHVKYVGVVRLRLRDGMFRKNPHAVALGRLGGKKGGPARAAKLTPEQRRESARKAGQASGKARLLSLTATQRSAIARKAALARWEKLK